MLADSPRSEFTLSEIARSVELNKTSCLGILAALAESGSVVKHPQTLRYSIGPAHIGLGLAASHRYDFVDVARVELDRFCHRDGLYWNVGTVSGTEMLVLAASEPRPPSLAFEPGHRFALTPPLGFVYISWSSPDLAERWLRQTVREDDHEQLAAYRDAMETTRRRGYSVGIQSAKQARLLRSLGELGRHPDQPDLADVALDLLHEVAFDEFLLTEIELAQTYEVSFLSAPIVDSHGSVVAAITVGGFTLPLTGHELVERCTSLVACAECIATAYPRSA